MSNLQASAGDVEAVEAAEESMPRRRWRSVRRRQQLLLLRRPAPARQPTSSELAPSDFASLACGCDRCRRACPRRRPPSSLSSSSNSPQARTSWWGRATGSWTAAWRGLLRASAAAWSSFSLRLGALQSPLTLGVNVLVRCLHLRDQPPLVRLSTLGQPELPPDTTNISYDSTRYIVSATPLPRPGK